MTHLPWWAYVLVCGGPTLLTVLFTPIALTMARRLNIFDMPGAAKAHTSPVPYLGGAAIVAAFSIIVMTAALIRPPTSGLPNLALVLGMALALSAMGLIDDMRGLSPWLRLAVEAGAGIGVWASGARANLIPGPADALVTVLFVVVVTNAFNLLDNMDGLSAGVATIAAGFLFVVAYLNGQFLVASLAIALAGCSFGFLRHNFHPARIYMGDAGSLFIGFLVAVLCLRLRTHSATRLTFFIPLLIIGVPLFDTCLVSITRLWHGRSPLTGGKDHVSHRLVRLGVPVRGAVSLIYGAGIALGWLSLIELRIDRKTGLMLVALVVSVAGFLGALLSLVPVYDEAPAIGLDGLDELLDDPVGSRSDHDRGETRVDRPVAGPWGPLAAVVEARYGGAKSARSSDPPTQTARSTNTR